MGPYGTLWVLDVPYASFCVFRFVYVSVCVLLRSSGFLWDVMGPHEF